MTNNKTRRSFFSKAGSAGLGLAAMSSLPSESLAASKLPKKNANETMLEQYFRRFGEILAAFQKNELENIEKQIFLDVKNSVRDIETNAKRVQAYRLARELAEQRLEAEVKKLNVGLTTNYFVLQFQEGLERERSLELRSLIDYNLAWARLEKAVGSSLEKRNIKISQFDK